MAYVLIDLSYILLASGVLSSCLVKDFDLMLMGYKLVITQHISG